MKNRPGLALAAALSLCAPQQAPERFKPALPGYRFEFPRDYFNHPENIP